MYEMEVSVGKGIKRSKDKNQFLKGNQLQKICVLPTLEPSNAETNDYRILK